MAPSKLIQSRHWEEMSRRGKLTFLTNLANTKWQYLLLAQHNWLTAKHKHKRRDQWIHIVLYRPQSTQRLNRQACSEVTGWETEVRGVVFPSPGEPTWLAVLTSAHMTSAPWKKKKVSASKGGGGEKDRERAGAGELQCLFTFPQITLVAHEHKFRNLNKKTLILLCCGGCDLWRVCCLTYYSAVTLINFTDNMDKKCLDVPY